ncbi:MAG TPA: EthD family reductase [Terriglobales bacterium]|nr:EthD family reductase [Terriglobales bacterium]
MVKVSVFYPNRKGARFDIEYYCNRHMPLVQRLVGAALKGVAVEQGICGEQPGSPPAHVALGHLLFDSVDAFQKSFGPHAQEIMADIPNYTNIEPTIQISEVKL